MSERVIWTGTENPLTAEALENAKNAWIAGSYTATAKNDKCYILWGEKPVLSIAARESDGAWELVMAQNPNMGPFPDKVMDKYVELMAPVLNKILTAPSAEITETPQP